MKTIKCLIASSMLTVAATTNALTIQNYIVTSSLQTPAIYSTVDSSGDPISFNLPISGGGIGTASLNDVGVLTMFVNHHSIMDMSSILSQPSGLFLADTITTSAIMLNSTGTGPYNLNNNGSTATTISCTNGPMDSMPGGGCAATIVGSPVQLYGPSTYYSAQSFTLASGLINIKSFTYGALVTTTYTLTAVPVPASVWLFGSALLGLTGTRRHRAQPK